MVPGMNEDPASESNEVKMVLFAVGSMLLFGTSFWGLVVVLKGIPPVTLGLLRALLVASFMFLLFLFMSRIMGNKRMVKKRNILFGGVRGKRVLPLVLSISLFSTVFPNLFQNTGMTMMDPGSTSSLTALIQGVSPIFTIIMAVILLHEKLGKWKIIGLLIALPASVVLTTYGSTGFEIGSQQTLGAFLNVLTALSYSISGILIKTAFNRGASPAHLVLVNAMYGFLLLIPVTFVFWLAGWEDPVSIFVSGLHIWLALFYVSVGLYGITAIIWYIVIRSGELSRVTFFVFLIPVFSYIVGYLLLDERLNNVQLLAGALLLFGVGISQIRKQNVLSRESD
jgi:drug/metabolite transporter (DMT)-like permease